MKKIILFTLLFASSFISQAQPGGVDCASAAANMITLPFYQTGLSNCGANNITTSNISHCGGSPTPYTYLTGDDRLYTFVIPAGVTRITIQLASSSPRVSLFLHNGCPTDPGTCVSTHYSTTSNGWITNAVVTPGSTYYLVVSSLQAGSPNVPCHNNYDLSIVPSPTSLPNTQDCLGAIDLCSASGSSFFSNYFAGTGNIPNEIDPALSCLGSGEKNDVWLKYTAQATGLLSFSITPINLSDDYDWAVFDITNNACSDIATNASLEVGCNYSGAAGTTGPNGGVGSQNEPPINVIVDHTYVINISQFSPSLNGFNLSFSGSGAPSVAVEPTLAIAPLSQTCGASSIRVNFSKQIRCSALDLSNFVITDNNATSYTVNSINSSSCVSAFSTTDQATLTFVSPLTTIGTYTLHTSPGTLVDNCGTANTTTIVSTFSVTPYTFSVNGITTICTGETTTLTAFGGASTYTWSNGNTGNPQIFSPSQTTTITVTGTNAAGCSKTIDKVITVSPIPILTITGDNFICAGEITTLTAGGASTYTWSNGDSGTTQTFNPSTTTTISVIGKNNGCQTTENYTITVEALPVLTLTGLANVCVGETATYTVSGATSYTWNSGSIIDTTIISPINNTTLTVSGYSINGCQNTIDKNISVSSVNVSTTVNNNTISANAVGANYQWIDCANSNSMISGATAKDFTPTINGSYAVIVTENNCIDTSACIAITTIGITEMQKTTTAISVYPNPSHSGELILKSITEKKVTIINQLNQVIQYVELNEKNSFETTITIAESGIYYLIGEGVYNKLVVIKE